MRKMADKVVYKYFYMVFVLILLALFRKHWLMKRLED